MPDQLHSPPGKAARPASSTDRFRAIRRPGGRASLPVPAIGLALSLLSWDAQAQPEREEPARRSGNEQVLAPVQVTASPDKDAEESYKAPSTIGRVPSDPKRVPQTITSVTAKRISDQNIRSNLDLLTSTPGAEVTGNEGFFRIRGYSAQAAIDGISVGNFVGRTSADLTPFEQVEVLKGPAALFSGSGSPGGTVNYTFKRPRDAQALDASIGLGHPSSKLLTADYNIDPLLEGRFRARLVGSWENRDLWTAPERMKRTSLYGVMELDLTRSTTARFAYWRQQEDSSRSFRQALPAYRDGRLIDFPRGTTPTQDWNIYHFRARWLMADLEHRFSDRWGLKLSFRKGTSEHPSVYAVARNGVCTGPLAGIGYVQNGIDPANPDGRQCFGAEYWNDRNDNEIYDLTLTGAFDVLGRTHGVILGFTQENSWFRRADGLHANPDDEFLFDIFNPNPRVRGPLPMEPVAPMQAKGSPNERYNLFGMVTINVTDRLRLPLASRLTWLKTSEGAWTAKDEFTPSVAAVYDLTPGVSAYVQYARMFTANTSNYGWNPDWAAGERHAPNEGILLPNVTGTQREIGVKANVFGGRALATAALFEIKEQNRARDDTDPDHPAAGTAPFRVASGSTRSRGVELSIAGQIRPRWDIWAGYAFIDARYTSDDRLQGVAIGTARHSGGIWTNYRFAPGALERLSLGTGLRFSGKFMGSTTDGNDTNRVKGPGYAVMSARAGYRLSSHYSLSLNVDNLFDRKYYEILGSRGSGNYHGEARRVSLRLHGRF